MAEKLAEMEKRMAAIEKREERIRMDEERLKKEEERIKQDEEKIRKEKEELEAKRREVVPGEIEAGVEAVSDRISHTCFTIINTESCFSYIAGGEVDSGSATLSMNRRVGSPSMYTVINITFQIFEFHSADI